MVGDFYLQSGTTLKLVVGQAGVLSSSGNCSNGGGGGGGGSFVWESGASLPLIAAGGGGGSGLTNNGSPNYLGMDAVTSQDGTAARDGSPGGTNGGDGNNGGGKGWYSVQSNPQGTDGSSNSYNGTGGFGGGGRGATQWPATTTNTHQVRVVASQVEGPPQLGIMVCRWLVQHRLQSSQHGWRPNRRWAYLNRLSWKLN